MKHLNLPLILCLFLCLLSCDPDNNPEPQPAPDKSGTATILPSSVSIDDNAGTVYFNVKSNTGWTVGVNNYGNGGIKDIDVSPLSGSGNGTIKVKYGKRSNVLSNIKESAVIIIYYYDYGYRQTITATIKRK